ncbi:hypothetical protein AVEN_197520-1 [Araneus ventricosus]|uniref:Secreted protein n=1 Tax=Araneus ventricosus TaxID=182803 RepID=A0A4Y2BT73_ARAVE|nr:hypothetical protein AVEN_197520-1 [Araneus ventricosus]
MSVPVLLFVVPVLLLESDMVLLLERQTPSDVPSTAGMLLERPKTAVGRASNCLLSSGVPVLLFKRRCCLSERLKLAQFCSYTIKAWNLISIYERCAQFHL